jgi:hypothetical protein
MKTVFFQDLSVAYKNVITVFKNNCRYDFFKRFILDFRRRIIFGRCSMAAYMTSVRIEIQFCPLILRQKKKRLGPEFFLGDLGAGEINVSG